MKKSKTSISKATSYKEIGEFWDTHSLADYREKTKPVSFDVNIQSEVTYFPLERGLSAQILTAARQQGVSPETLLNVWIQERLQKA
jgi:hypothetical protein